MADGAAGGMPEAELTPEERVDAAIASARFGEVGVGSLGVGERMGTGGGGGAGGQFVFADLADLNRAIGEWEAYRDRTKARVRKCQGAVELMTPMAGDMMSHFQAAGAETSLEKKRDHELALLGYADAFVQKLTASRSAMAATEQENADRLRTPGQDLGYG